MLCPLCIKSPHKWRGNVLLKALEIEKKDGKIEIETFKRKEKQSKGITWNSAHGQHADRSRTCR